MTATVAALSSSNEWIKRSIAFFRFRFDDGNLRRKEEEEYRCGRAFHIRITLLRTILFACAVECTLGRCTSANTLLLSVSLSARAVPQHHEWFKFVEQPKYDGVRQSYGGCQKLNHSNTFRHNFRTMLGINNKQPKWTFYDVINRGNLRFLPSHKLSHVPSIRRQLDALWRNWLGHCMGVCASGRILPVASFNWIKLQNLLQWIFHTLSCANKQNTLTHTHTCQMDATKGLKRAHDTQTQKIIILPFLHFPHEHRNELWHTKGYNIHLSFDGNRRSQHCTLCTAFRSGPVDRVYGFYRSTKSNLIKESILCAWTTMINIIKNYIGHHSDSVSVHRFVQHNDPYVFLRLPLPVDSHWLANILGLPRTDSAAVDSIFYWSRTNIGYSMRFEWWHLTSTATCIYAGGCWCVPGSNNTFFLIILLDAV